MEIPLFELERLEEQYGVHIHLDQYPNKEEIYQVFPSILCINENRIFLGNTIEEAETKLRSLKDAN